MLKAVRKKASNPQEARLNVLVFDDPLGSIVERVFTSGAFEGFEFVILDQIEDLKLRIEQDHYDLCLVAHRLSVGVLESVIDSACSVDTWTPVAIVAEQHSPEEAERFISHGAIDFLAWNNLTDEGIAEQLRNNVFRGRQVEGLVRSASMDRLTGLFSRRYMETHIDRIIWSQQRSDVNATALFIDLDHFKQVNDDISYQAGDEVLQLVAETIGRSVRGHDVVGRWGGDEFVVLINNTDAEGNRIVAQRINDAVRMMADRLHVDVSASIGIAPLTRSIRTVDDWLNEASAAMKAAKALGGDQYATCDDALPMTRQRCANYS